MDIWGPLSVVVAGMGVIAPFAAERRRRVNTRIEYVITRNQRLLNVPQGVSVEISVEGQPVDQAFVTVLRIANTGTTNFPPDSWDSPLVVQLGSSSVISAQQIAARPTGWRVEAPVVSGGSIEIAPSLFNAGDLLELQIVSDGAIPNPSVRARIAGVKEISRRRPVYNLGNGPDGELDRGNQIAYVIFGLFFLAAAMLVLWGPIVTATGQPLPLPNRLTLAGYVIGGLGLYIAFLRWATIRNRVWRAAERF